MSTGSILSILAYSQYGYHLVYHTGLSLVHCSYLSVRSLPVEGEQEDVEGEQEEVEGWEECDDHVHMTDEGETSGSGLGSRMRDLGRLTLHLPLVLCTAMRQNTVSVLGPKRLERGCLGGL